MTPGLTPSDRRKLRQVARGLRATDPEWARQHDLRWRPLAARLTRLAMDIIAIMLMVVGTSLVSLPLVFAEEVLQPDDWLVMHTDGITEARDQTGEFFGDARLVDFLRREAATGHPPPETARRLVQAVLAHQNGKLQDDATVLLARWTNRRDLMP
jgi:serine/threonine protein phosphatase PrpC